ncbi:UDP-N-acetylglucosamine 2-epimerase [Paenibacillus alginolyticus]|uniref:MGDG synthase family glycosyltransferase n=1 Tax=Paenibacillus alginolyticus TaxID=59839 RepID=UPI000407EB06|nr:glycosyltransferase [Paenibacillus alginolyticus]MCY9669605.1 UDP-N-acetylglucosamine 2-epimerase [Paenibacillus alginolyticus]
MTYHSRILILTAGYGEGHLLASIALKEHFLKLGVEFVQVIDLMQEAHPLINKISCNVYKGSFGAARYGFNYYGWSYYLTQDAKSHNPLLTVLNRLGYRHLKNIVSNYQPDVIINTFPYGAAPAIGRAFGIPTYTIITDYVIHARWLHPHIHKYYVATNELKRDMLNVGIHESHIEVTGIPVREAFETNQRIHKNRKMVLLFASSHPNGELTEELIKKLQFIDGYHLTVVCGRNKKLEQMLNNRFDNFPNVTIYGFVEQITELMAQASCIISKAGGLTLAESLTLQIPVFIYRPFPGQEKDNAIYFSRKGAAAISHDINHLLEQIERFLTNSSYAKRLKSQMAALNQTKAADTIVKDILKNLYDRKSATYS